MDQTEEKVEIKVFENQMVPDKEEIKVSIPQITVATESLPSSLGQLNSLEMAEQKSLEASKAGTKIEEKQESNDDDKIPVGPTSENDPNLIMPALFGALERDPSFTPPTPPKKVLKFNKGHVIWGLIGLVSAIILCGIISNFCVKEENGPSAASRNERSPATYSSIPDERDKLLDSRKSKESTNKQSSSI